MKDTKVIKARAESERRIKRGAKWAETRRQSLGLWDLIVAGGLYCSAYVLYFQDSPTLKVYALIAGLKATQIAYERFIK